jgi:hypothetical protein
VPDEEDVSVDSIDVGHGVKQSDNEAWQNKRRSGHTQCARLEVQQGSNVPPLIDELLVGR